MATAKNLFPSGSFCILTVLIMTWIGLGNSFNNVLKNSQLEFDMNLSGTSGSSFVDGHLYPVQDGLTLTQYFVYMGIYGWTENVTNRNILPSSNADLKNTNPIADGAEVAWNFSAPYSSSNGEFTFQLLPPGTNTTFGGFPIVGLGGLKLSGQIQGDSNVYNISTAKFYYFNITLSHPILNYSISTYPTPYQDNFNFTTAYYTAVFNQPSFTVSDGKNTGAYATIQSLVISDGNLMGFIVKGTTFWESTWLWDPEISIILDPGVGGTQTGGIGGDGGSNTNLAYIALVALVLAPIVVIVIVIVGIGFFYLRRRRLVKVTESRIGSMDAAEAEENA